MWVDGVLTSLRAYRELGNTLTAMDAGRPFVRDLFAYYRVGFHPSQLDDSRALDSFHCELRVSPIYAEARDALSCGAT